MFMSYGVRDWLELGFVADMVNFRTTGQELPKGSYGAGGPMARIRLVARSQLVAGSEPGRLLELGDRQL